MTARLTACAALLGALAIASTARAQPAPADPSIPASAPASASASAPASASASASAPASASASAPASAPAPAPTYVIAPYSSTGEAAPTYDVAPRAKLKRYVQRHVGFEAGMRTTVVLDEGYDPYSSNDLLPHFAASATWVPLRMAPFSVGLVGEYDLGGSSGMARGDATSMLVQRASLGLQARLALGSRVYTFAKAAPSVMYMRGSITDAAVDRPLTADAWTWGVDATGGAAVMIGRAGDPDWPALRVWIVGEIGYAFAGKSEMVFSPEERDDDPRMFGSVRLPGFRPAGVVNRLALALTF